MRSSWNMLPGSILADIVNALGLHIEFGCKFINGFASSKSRDDFDDLGLRQYSSGVLFSADSVRYGRANLFAPRFPPLVMRFTAVRFRKFPSMLFGKNLSSPRCGHLGPGLWGMWDSRATPPTIVAIEPAVSTGAQGCDPEHFSLIQHFRIRTKILQKDELYSINTLLADPSTYWEM